MRIRPRAIALCIVLGVIINITVAWTAAVLGLSTAKLGPLIPKSLSPIPWPTMVPTDWPGLAYGPHRRHSTEHSIRRFFNSSIHDDARNSIDYEVVIQQSGFPRPALRSTVLVRELYQGPRHIIEPDLIDNGIAVPRWWTRRNDLYAKDRRIPLTPLLPGFLYNTLIYSVGVLVAYFLVMLAPPAVRRFIRHRRRRCPACGYSLLGLPAPTCPECGPSKPPTAPFSEPPPAPRL